MKQLKTEKLSTLSEQNLDMFRIICKAADCLGANVIKPNFQVSVMTYVTLIFIVIYHCLAAYTIYTGVVYQNDWNVAMSCLCFVGPGIQGASKFVNALMQHKQFRALYVCIVEIFAYYEARDERFREALKKSLVLNKRIVYILLEVYGVTVCGCVTIPILYRLVMNSYVSIMQFNVPGLDQSTEWGYISVLVIQLACITVGSFGNFASDTFCYLLVAYIPLMKDIMKCKLDELDELVRLYPRNRAKSFPQLQEVIEWHQKYIDYCNRTNSAFFWVIFVQMAMSCMSIVCTIVCMFLGEYPPAPALITFFFVVMYCYCGLGNLVENSNDEVTTYIYDCLWYDLTVPEQKMILIMLHKSQQCEGMSIGGVSPLSLNSGVQMTKSIYSLAMLLNESLN